MMARYRLSEDAALSKLKAHSQDLNIKLSALAEEIVAAPSSQPGGSLGPW